MLISDEKANAGLSLADEVNSDCFGCALTQAKTVLFVGQKLLTNEPFEKKMKMIPARKISK